MVKKRLRELASAARANQDKGLRNQGPVFLTIRVKKCGVVKKFVSKFYVNSASSIVPNARREGRICSCGI